MKNPLITLILALACYTVANVLNNSPLNISVVPMTAAIFAAIGAYIALAISHGIK